jgi:hypothetical protein
MKFIYADSLDYVDPNYDFIEDRHGAGRKPYWDDQFSHEYMETPPYDGLLVSRATVGGQGFSGKYTGPQARRFRRVGAAEFLRYKGDMIIGDCGAFSYHRLSEPPYSAEDTVEFYEDGGFTHGCSVDHIIFDCNPSYDNGLDVPNEFRRRFDITLANAEEFFPTAKILGNRFTPLGVVQGWSPESMADAAQKLEAMGYQYLAVGGLVPLKAPLIKQCLMAIRERIRSDTKLHVLGFAKADNISEFSACGITSFDTTSPMLRSFKDGKSNYWLPNSKGKINYYTAIRIPQSLTNNKLKRWAKTGRYQQEKLQDMEKAALESLRAFDRDGTDVERTLDAVMRYSEPLFFDEDKDAASNGRILDTYRQRYEQTLTERPWKRCQCTVCCDIGVEVIIFRGSNRNKRRGMHNLAVYQKHLRDSLSRSENHGDDHADFFSDQGAAE